MSKDDVGPKRPPREEDPSYITMPPELRAYDTGPLEDTAIKPGDDPILDAAVAGIRVLDGDPNADPFYYDVRKRRAEAKKNAGAGAGNVTAYVAPTGVRSASEVRARDSAPAKVVIAELDDPLSTRAIDVRAFRGMSAAVRPVTAGGGEEPTVDRSEESASDASEKPPEASPSPWSKEAVAPESVRASALPSSLRPGGVPTPTTEKPAATPARDRPNTKAVITVALVLVALGVLVTALTTRHSPENGSQGPAPTVTMTPFDPLGANCSAAGTAGTCTVSRRLGRVRDASVDAERRACARTTAPGAKTVEHRGRSLPRRGGAADSGSDGAADRALGSGGPAAGTPAALSNIATGGPHRGPSWRREAESLTMRTHRTISAFTLAVTLTWSATSFAELPVVASTSPDEALSDTARELFAKGVKASQEQKWDQCRAAFLAALGVKRVAQIAGNLALCEQKLGLYRDAAEHIAFFLSVPPRSDAPPERRTAAEAVLREASARVVTVHAHVDVDGAEVAVDERAVGTAPLGIPIFLDPGPHTITARRDGYPTAREAVDARAGASVGIGLKLVQARPLWPVIVTGILAAGGLAAGGGLVAAANSKRNDAAGLRVELGGGSSQCVGAASGKCQTLASDLKSQATLANGAVGGFVAGGAFALATAGLGLWTFGKPSAPTNGQIRVVPAVGTAERGVRIEGSW